MALVILIIMGGFSMGDAIVGDGTIPEPKYLSKNSPTRVLIKHNTTKSIGKGLELPSHQECWNQLDATFKILDDIAPHVSDWVREKQTKGELIIDADTRGMYASFDCISRELTLYRSFFDIEDGEKAITLAHEWRHSKQNIGKFVKLVMGCAITKELHEDLIENDAYFYEAKIRESLYGY